MLFIDPHLPYYGPGQVYEAHFHSDQGWEFSGYMRFGFPFPYVGHNGSHGWMSTDNVADEVDGCVEDFADPGEPLVDRYGNERKLARQRNATIIVKTAGGNQARQFRTVWTLHGPIIGTYHGHPLSVRLPMYESHGWLREWYDMTRARALAELHDVPLMIARSRRCASCRARCGRPTPSGRPCRLKKLSAPDRLARPIRAGSPVRRGRGCKLGGSRHRGRQRTQSPS